MGLMLLGLFDKTKELVSTAIVALVVAYFYTVAGSLGLLEGPFTPNLNIIQLALILLVPGIGVGLVVLSEL